MSKIVRRYVLSNRYAIIVRRSCLGPELDIFFGRFRFWLFLGPALLFNRAAFGRLRFALFIDGSAV